jgi:hypothetical protein
LQGLGPKSARGPEAEFISLHLDERAPDSSPQSRFSATS